MRWTHVSLFSILTLQQDTKSSNFEIQSVEGQSSRRYNDVDTCARWKFSCRGYLCYCAMHDEGNSIPTGGPGNQLPLSRGSGLATREWQHARQPRGQAVIVWFTHNQLLIVSHWAAGTCNFEKKKRVWIHRGFGRQSYCVPLVKKERQVL